MNIKDKVAVVTGAASGIGRAVSNDLARHEAAIVALVDRSEGVIEFARELNASFGREVGRPYVGDVTSDSFRQGVYEELHQAYRMVNICIPAAGLTRDTLAVKVDKETDKIVIYPIQTFRQVTEVNLVAPVYWALEMAAGIASERRNKGLKRWDPNEGVQGVVILIGSVSSLGNKGQIAYAATKAGLEGAAATLMTEAIFHGVRCAVIHPGYTNTPMVRALGDTFIKEHIIPQTQLRRLMQPEELADAICFMISNDAVSGPLWADAGWHPQA